MSAINELRRRRGLRILQERLFEMLRVYVLEYICTNVCSSVWRSAEVSPCHPCNVNGVLSSLRYLCTHTMIPEQSHMIIPCLLSCTLWKSWKKIHYLLPSSIFHVTIEAVQLWSFSCVSPFMSLQKEQKSEGACCSVLAVLSVMEEVRKELQVYFFALLLHIVTTQAFI
jgi:hypothetical protein